MPRSGSSAAGQLRITERETLAAGWRRSRRRQGGPLLGDAQRRQVRLPLRTAESGMAAASRGAPRGGRNSRATASAIPSRPRSDHGPVPMGSGRVGSTAASTMSRREEERDASRRRAPERTSHPPDGGEDVGVEEVVRPRGLGEHRNAGAPRQQTVHARRGHPPRGPGEGGDAQHERGSGEEHASEWRTNASHPIPGRHPEERRRPELPR